MVNVFALAGGALDHIIDVIGRAAIEAVLDISDRTMSRERNSRGRSGRAGARRTMGGSGAGCTWRIGAVRVERPRLRSPGEGELAIPAYEALRRPSGLGERMLELLLAGLSTRSYGKAIGEMAETAGVSKSSVSRQAAEAAGERLKELSERQLDDRDYLIVYVDGIQFGGHHVLAALGVDDEGNKRILGLREGASENAVVAAGAAREPRRRGLDPGRARLFVLDGSKSAAQGGWPGLRERVPRAALPEPQDAQCDRAICPRNSTTRPAPCCGPPGSWARRTARRGSSSSSVLGGEAASGRSGKPARRARRDVHRHAMVGLTPALRRCLGTTNVIDNVHSGMRRRTGRVTRWRDGSMAVRWAAAAFLDAEKGYRRIMGYKDLWILKAHLDELGTPPVEEKEVAA